MVCVHEAFGLIELCILYDFYFQYYVYYIRAVVGFRVRIIQELHAIFTPRTSLVQTVGGFCIVYVFIRVLCTTFANSARPISRV